MTWKSDLRAEFDVVVQHLTEDLKQGGLSSLPSKMVGNLEPSNEIQLNNNKDSHTSSMISSWLQASTLQRQQAERTPLPSNVGTSQAFNNSLQGLLVNSSMTSTPSQSIKQSTAEQTGDQNPNISLASQLFQELGKTLQTTRESVLPDLSRININSGSSSILSSLASQGVQRSVNPLRWLTSPLMAGLGWLFGKGDDEETATPPLANLPRRMSIDAGYDRRENQLIAIAGSAGGLSRPAVAESSTIQPNITIQVNALDTRSFADHSNEIAQALRKAMLESHSINDMLAEL